MGGAKGRCIAVVAGLNARAIALELDGDSPDPLFIESLGHAIVVRYLRQFSTHTIEIARPSGLSRERLRRVLDYIEAHLADALTLDALAGVACLSPFHLSRSFQRSIGIGLHRYVVQRRIDRAKQLVVSTDLAITQIAAAVGFESAAAFSTRFRQFVGRSPSSFRDDRILRSARTRKRSAKRRKQATATCPMLWPGRKRGGQLSSR